MIINANIQVDSRLKLVVRKKNGGIRETPWFKNIVLNNGLNRCAKGEGISRLYVGAGSALPAESQINLDNPIAFTTTKIPTYLSGRNNTSPPYYSYSITRWQFSTGAAAGNLSEIGLGYGDGSLYNRALIKDELGNPVTITVLSDEILDVYVECREYMSLTSSGSSSVKNKLGDITQELSVIYKPFNISGGGSDRTPALEFGALAISSLPAPPITGPMNTNVGAVDLTSSSPHPTKSNCRRATYRAGFDLANGSIKTLAVSFYCLGASSNDSFERAGGFVEITPAFNKTGLMEVDFIFDIAINRYNNEPT